MHTTTSSARARAFEAVMAEAALQGRGGDPRTALERMREDPGSRAASGRARKIDG